MNEVHKKALLKVARDTVEAVITGRSVPKVKSDDPKLNAACGCFVTLKNRDQLRGCIGRFTSEKPLIELVVEMAKASATGDPRFLSDPITPAELEGIYVTKGFASGCFLPQVATETGWTKEEFLSYCCAHKAGLSADAWQDPDTEVYLFTADVFGALFKEI
jgi:AMMECR1 domain-containing protein